jgi:hypothetical protein
VEVANLSGVRVMPTSSGVSVVVVSVVGSVLATVTVATPRAVAPQSSVTKSSNW